MSQEETFINGELLRVSREARGWGVNDMATRACMSVKQIRQLEEGGMSAFYSAAVKATSAKKVGGLLGLSADQVFGETQAPAEIEDAVEPEAMLEQAEDETVKPTLVEIEAEKPDQITKTAIQVETKSTSTKNSELQVAQQTTEDTRNSKNSLWMIAVLLAVAFALGAYFQPQEEPVAAEPAPPIQVLPTEAVDPASAASAADVAASSAEVAVIQASAPLAVVSQKPASTVSATTVAPIVSTAASAARVATPVASASVRSTSPVVVTSPTASSAVKAP
jgi:transcriptional regulator with XRE-family HTH domain